MEHIPSEVFLVVLVVAIVIALSSVSDRLGIAPPLILMLVGVGISFLPFVTPIEIKPEWILMVILPPLLYGAALAIPTVDFRRDFSAVGGLAVFLVVASALIMGLIIHWIIPDVSLAYGIALGAILSPTDAAATTIARRLGVPSRVSIILQGESLLNDATALVLLRSAIAAAAATAGSVSVWKVAGDFLWAALAAAAIGAVIGWLGVRVRRLIHESAGTTAMSFLIPFLAFIPAELVHASGLVAVVAAGLVAAQKGPKHLDARQRLSEQANWHTVEYILEGAVFFIMGLELKKFILDVHQSSESLWAGLGIAALALFIITVLRGGFIAGLVKATQHTSSKKIERSEKLKDVDLDLALSKRDELLMERRAHLKARLSNWDNTEERKAHRLEYFTTLAQRYIADAEYLIRQPLGFKEGSLLIWGGMRGVVTLAAAQTLPAATPHRSLMILIAFFVAAGSLVIQGGTLGWAVKGLGLDGMDVEPEGEWERLQNELKQGAKDWKQPETKPVPDALVPLAKLRAQRAVLLELRSTGTYSSSCLAHALNELDAEELGLQIRLHQGD
ncbi:MAG: sodium:proton antiporter [Propionibacteriaceae bacterium]|jgi:CPA1 family monovalent cation:H+ antiporter|nr:sodium:proton antiporter [Propionibacteriaceae bacterium]